MVPTWVGPCTDGLFYKNPVWFGPHPDGGNDWFLCLDDDDPPELVVRLGSPLPCLDWFAPSRTYGRDGMRMLLKDAAGCRFTPAKAFFGRLIGTPPPPQRHYHAVKPEDREREMCGDLVLYDTTKFNRVPNPGEEAGPLPKVAEQPPRDEARSPRRKNR